MYAFDFTDQRNRLATLLPRGRFERDTDGTCIVTAARAVDADAHLFEHTPGKIVGLCYVGGPCRYLRALDGLIGGHLRGAGEGIVYLAWKPEIAERLPAFSRGRPRGASFTTAVRAVPAAVGDERGTDVREADPPQLPPSWRPEPRLQRGAGLAASERRARA